MRVDRFKYSIFTTALPAVLHAYISIIALICQPIEIKQTLSLKVSLLKFKKENNTQIG